MTRVAAIKSFFEKDGGRKVTMDELKQLTEEDKKWLGDECAKALGTEITAN